MDTLTRGREAEGQGSRGAEEQGAGEQPFSTRRCANDFAQGKGAGSRGAALLYETLRERLRSGQGSREQGSSPSLRDAARTTSLRAREQGSSTSATLSDRGAEGQGAGEK